MLLETDAGGAPLVSYTLANGQLISLVRDGVPSYYLGDGQGSVRALVDSAGAISDTYAYTAFGELYAQSGATENSYLYTGQQFDEVTGLYSLRARYYAPGLGRFLSQDTAGVSYGNPVELNRYVYTVNNPVNMVDPSGYVAMTEKTITDADVQNRAGAVPDILQVHELRMLTAPTFAQVAEALPLAVRILAIVMIFNLMLAPVIAPEAIVSPEALTDPDTQTDTETQTKTKTQIQEEPEYELDVDVCAYGDPSCDDSKECNLQSMISWMSTLKKKEITPSDDHYRYQVRTCGDYEYEATANGGTVKIWADGIDVGTCRLLEAKHASDPSDSPFHPDAVPLHLQFQLELVRYAAVVYDPSTPIVGLEIRTNAWSSISYFANELNNVALYVGTKGFVTPMD